MCDFIYYQIVYTMKLPDHYKNLDVSQKKIIIADLVSQLWNESIQNEIAWFNDEQVEFLFTYFFTESREEREKMWHDARNNYQIAVKHLKMLAERLQKLDFRFAELLAQKEDAENFWKSIR